MTDKPRPLVRLAQTVFLSSHAASEAVDRLAEEGISNTYVFEISALVGLITITVAA